jgi:hypothetical protein
VRRVGANVSTTKAALTNFHVEAVVWSGGAAVGVAPCKAREYT